MDIKFRNEGENLMVDVEIPQRRTPNDPHTRVGSKEVLDMMKKNGYNVDEYNMEKDSYCSTEGKNPSLSSTWIFRKVANERPTQSVKQRSRTTRRKTTANKENKLLGTKDMGGVQS